MVLVEKDPRVARVWRFLIRARPADVLDLPLLDPDTDATIDDLPPCDPDGRELIRSWISLGTGSSARAFTPRARAWARMDRPQAWSAACRRRLALQVNAIKHWQLIEGDYTQAPDIDATWFVDPPYNNAAGRAYKFHDIDYPALGAWCMSRRGHVLVCENMGADWLPFEPLFDTMNNSKSGVTKWSIEALWQRTDDRC